MARQVVCAARSLRAYREAVEDALLAEVIRLARPLHGARVLHLNATAHGGGVAELLRSLLPLLRGLGLDAEWHVLSGDDAFFGLTKTLHNALQGKTADFPPSARDAYLETLDANRELFAHDWDFVLVHDPQPAGLIGLLDGRRTGHWVWRCHVDTTEPCEAAIDFLAPYVSAFDAAIFTRPDYVAGWRTPRRVEFIAPAIDPLAAKNRRLPFSLARDLLAERFGIDPARPLMTQVSRFDPWKDPLGVIDAYRAVKRRVPRIQLALVGNMASDDPEGRVVHAETLAHAGEDPDIHVLSTLDRLSRTEPNHATEINAFQTGSDVIVQKSTREGFGLVVTEAMWKGTAVVGGRVGGIVDQIEDGFNGYLAGSAQECADRVVELLEMPAHRRTMGRRGRESVRRRFLLPRLARDELRLLGALAGCVALPAAREAPVAVTPTSPVTSDRSVAAHRISPRSTPTEGARGPSPPTRATPR